MLARKCLNANNSGCLTVANGYQMCCVTLKNGPMSLQNFPIHQLKA